MRNFGHYIATIEKKKTQLESFITFAACSKSCKVDLFNGSLFICTYGSTTLDEPQRRSDVEDDEKMHGDSDEHDTEPTDAGIIAASA